MKKLAIFLAIVIMLTSLVGCTKKTEQNYTNTYVYSPSIPNYSFERGDIGGWTGDTAAFNVMEDIAGAYKCSGRYFLISSGEGSGELKSGSFTLGNTGYVSFLMGAGDRCRVEVCVDDVAVKTILNTTPNDDRMHRVLVDMTEYLGERLSFKIVDNNSDSAYSYIVLDDFDVNVTPTDLAYYKAAVSEVK